MDSFVCGVPPFCQEIQCFGMFRSASRGSNKPNGRASCLAACRSTFPTVSQLARWVDSRPSLAWPGLAGLFWASVNWPKRALNKQTNNANHAGASGTASERNRDSNCLPNAPHISVLWQPRQAKIENV